jgi:hypothetical protein
MEEIGSNGHANGSACGINRNRQYTRRARPILGRFWPGPDFYAEREIPSFFIFDCSVVRFMPNRLAAPFGPPITQLDFSSTRRM